MEVWLGKYTICNPSSLVSRLIQAPLLSKRLINPVKVASGSTTANSFNRCRAANALFPSTLAEISHNTIVGLELTNPESMRLGLRRERCGIFPFCWLQQFSKFDSYVPGEHGL